MHNGVMTASLADGSVRMIAANINVTTFNLACTPSDGNVLGADWGE
jgi:hypothetical protein